MKILAIDTTAVTAAAALVEDGLFDLEISPAVAIFAEMIWDADADLNEMKTKVYHSEHFGH